MALNMAHNMTSHRMDADSIASVEDLRREFINTAEWVQQVTPESREQSLALTNLEQALMWAVAAIARNQPTVTSQEQ